jgi:hypothetical protein
MNQSERGHANLTRTLRVLAEIESTAETSDRVEAAVMAHWEASRRGGAKRERTRRLVRGTAVTAASITVVGALLWPRHTNEPSAPAAAEYTTVAVVGGPLMAGEPVRVVRMRVARSVLGELGISSAAQTETVDIDVLVGEDGVARGVRVPISEL